MLSKCFSFLSVVHAFFIPQKVQNPNLQCFCGQRDNSECEIVSEELSDYPLYTLYVYFTIIKPIAKFGFYFHIEGNFAPKSLHFNRYNTFLESLDY